MATNRNTDEVRETLLVLCSTPERMTKISLALRMNSETAKIHISRAERFGLITTKVTSKKPFGKSKKKSIKTYHTTEKGLKYLELMIV